jgi:endonuclease/exonuclease/phosphatase family metal-dependent hydrolase
MRAFSLVFLALLTACPIGIQDGDRDDDDRDAGPDTGYPAPATDLVAPRGAADTFEIASWNVKNFPCGNESFSSTCRAEAADTPSLLADLIASMDLDIVALQEIADEEAFQEVVDRLPEHEGVLSSHTYGDGSYQKIGYVYRSTEVEAGTASLLFQSSDNFPRPALQTQFTWSGLGTPIRLTAISVHLKAGEGGDDRDRRTGAIAQLEQYMQNLVDGSGDDNLIALGDFNETVDDAAGQQVFLPFRDPSRYVIRTEANAESGEATFIPSDVILDAVTVRGRRVGDHPHAARGAGRLSRAPERSPAGGAGAVALTDRRATSAPSPRGRGRRPSGAAPRSTRWDRRG